MTEHELVRNAMQIDSDGESVWIYHAWLIGSGKLGGLAAVTRVLQLTRAFLGDDAALLQQEIASIQELLHEQPDSKCKSQCGYPRRGRH